MIGPYLESQEIDQLDELLKHSAEDTISCWIATRLNGASASLACDGNISSVLLKELDKKMMPYVEKAKRDPYQEGLDRVASTPMPEEQKFPIGARVKIADDLGPMMAHFRGHGKEATVEYTHAHAYGGSSVKSYSLNVDGVGINAWYEEHQLTLIIPRPLEEGNIDNGVSTFLKENGA